MNYRSILQKIKPTKQEEKTVHSLGLSYAKKIKIKKTKTMIGGSIAKNTWLKGNHDIDIYVLFDPIFYRDLNISDILHDHVPPEAKRVHGSRDYFQLSLNEYIIEFIPILHIKHPDEAQNITDISPFHVRWVKKYKKYANDIRLVKALAKAQKFYGAESYIKGFSGYSLEVLTIYYKGFQNLIKNVAQWSDQTIIDPEKHHKKEVSLNPSKMISPLILVDPVQAGRNVTSVVSKEKYNLFIHTAKQILSHKSKSFFFATPFSLGNLVKQRKDGTLIIIDVLPLDGKKDVVGAKLLQAFDHLKLKFQEEKFPLNDSGWHWEDSAIFWFLFPRQLRPKLKKHYGPPTKEKERLQHFKETWKKYKVCIENDKSYVMIPQNYDAPEDMLESLLKEAYISSRYKEVKDQKVYKEG